MLPTRRIDGEFLAIPKLDLEGEDLDGFCEELKGFHSQFYDCFSRSESRGNFYRYMVGQFSGIERKSIEPIAISVEGGNVRSMQRFISNVVWDEEKILNRYYNSLNEDLGASDGVVIFDETGFIKKGNDSAGVCKQYSGTAGKVENCQVGVFMAYASRHGYSLMDSRLFIPEKWFGADYAEKRKKCKIPRELEFETKPHLAIEMFKNIGEKIPFKYVAADTIYGNSPEFIEAITDCVGVTYFVSVPKNTLCWLKQPITRKKTYKYKGKKREKTVLIKNEKKLLSVKTIARNLNNYFWYRRKVNEGSKGPIEYEFTKRRIVLSKGGLPWKTVWLVIRRTIGSNSEYSYYISNAMVSARLKIFVWLSGVRWAIEQCFKEAKSELGMDHYEVRKLHGWRHHMLISILSHFFLWHMMLKMGKKSARYYFATD